MTRIGASICALVVVLCAGGATAPPPAISPGATIPENASEQVLVQRITGFQKALANKTETKNRPELRAVLLQEAIAHVDALLSRFGETSFRDEALITQLTALAELARSKSAYLSKLLSITRKIAAGNAKGRLGSENAYFAIQAFVLGARMERIPKPRRLLGIAERYEAFLEDYPKSQRVPVIRASLIRNLIALDRIEQSRRELVKLQAEFPGHQATLRAQGELNRLVAVGRPFAFTHTMSDGRTIRTTDYLGKVLVVHFWATWSPASLEQLPILAELHRRFQDRGLQLIGINVDRDRSTMVKALDTNGMPWPQYFGEKGFENDVLISTGVINVPTCFVVDRRGILQDINRGGNLRELIGKMLGEPQQTP